MKTWRKVCELSPTPGRTETETWELWDGPERLATYPVAVTVGKPLDVLGLKAPDLQEMRDYARHLQDTAGSLYGEGAQLRCLKECPTCLYPAEEAREAARVFGVAYVRCPRCAHLFVAAQPLPQVLDAHFAQSDELAAVYTDSAGVEVRMNQVVMPKAQWLSTVFADLYGRFPAAVMDVGAGGGHFLAGMRRLGCAVHGFELSRASRSFAAKVFGLDLSGADFLSAPPRSGDFDVLSFWGLLEYTPRPRAFLERARQWLAARKGLLVLEVPRHECLGSAVQSTGQDRVTRHLDPTSHVNCFSDASLAFMLHDCGFAPVAAWYFGMDIYELLVQAAWEVDDNRLLERLAPLIPPAQAALDVGRACDDIVVAAVPREDAW